MKESLKLRGGIGMCNDQILRDIPSYPSWKVIEKINKGWSKDIKYYVEDQQGNKLLVRVADKTQYDMKYKEFNMIKKFNRIQCPMSRAVEFGRCNQEENSYMILTWVDGESLDTVLKQLPKEKQYALGLEAGKILKEIHSIDVTAEEVPLQDRRAKRLEQLSLYIQSNNRMVNDDRAIQYVKDNISKINTLQMVYQHGDFHPGNLILTPDQQIGVIDFNRWRYGDPYEEFQRLQSFTIEHSIPFAIGQITGYFNNNPTQEFWDSLAVYVAHTSLYSITWAEPFGAEDIKGMQRRCETAFQDYDYFNRTIPMWYKNDN